MITSNQMKPTAWVVGLLAIVVAAWFAFPHAVHVWKITDASKTQERRFTDSFHSFASGLFALRIVGTLSEPAEIVSPIGRIELPAGDFDFIAYDCEAWSSSETLQYLPSQSAKGNVTISVCLGFCPVWVHRPPPSALPAQYTGGWTAYYPGTDTKAWSGGFYHGVKWGRFTYFDQSGKITHQEDWENGKKKN